MSKKERDDFLQVFNALDTDFSGNLTKQEFIDGHQKFFGDGLTQEEVIELYNKADLDNNGTIEFSEFVAAAMNQEEKLSVKKLQDAFSAFDTDKNGSIDKEELMRVFEFSDEYNTSAIEEMIKEVDENGDGQIQFNEFKNMMMGE